jgi:RNA-binding protein Nova
LQNDGRSHQQGNYGAHNLSYFDQATTEAGSPPPNSASGSTSTSASLGVSDQTQGSTTSSSQQYSQPPPTTMSQTPHETETVDVPTTSTHAAAEDGKPNPTSFQSAIKLLVSNNVAGSIIGRAGQTISELQTQSSARIKLSQTGDYYPGTQDRVCLVQGQLSTVKLAVQLLLERFYMLQEQQHTQHLAWQPKKGENAPTSTGFDFVVRLLVPSSSCGMIIGKAGANIKHMEESSGVSSVRLSPKDGPDQPQAQQQHQPGPAGPGTQERAVTLTGPSKESCIKCLSIVIDGMFANHEISRYTNMTTSYSRHLVPGSYTPAQQQQPGQPPHMGSSPTGEWDNQDPYGGTFMIKKSTSQPDLSHMSMEQQQRLQSRIHSGSFVGGGGVTEIGQREPSLQQFNQSFMDSPQQPYNSEMPPPPPQMMMPNQDREQRSNAAVVPMYLLGGSNPSQLDHHPPILSSTSAPDLLALQFQDSLRLSNTQTLGPPPVDYNHFAPQMPQPTRPGFTAQILVPDTLIGSILGRGGRTLNELQLHSNTRIRISQRGEYVPGTRNRIVTIRGQTAHSVSLAQYLMSQRMVLPPTATFSAGPPVSPSYLHTPPQHQQHPPSPQRYSPHQQSSHYNAPLDSQAQQQHQQQNQVLHENSFLPTETHPYNPDNER